ncbi:hypothetical protein ID0048_08210 [Helicobacter pylori]
MAVRFNNNNSGWMEEMQILFDKVQSLLKLGSFLHGKTIESFDNPKNYPPITLPPLYHFRDNTFHFIFNVSNNFLSRKSRLTIEVPRVALENIKLPDMKEIYVNQWYINIFINTLIFSINKGSYILTGV